MFLRSLKAIEPPAPRPERVPGTKVEPLRRQRPPLLEQGDPEQVQQLVVARAHAERRADRLLGVGGTILLWRWMRACQDAEEMAEGSPPLAPRASARRA